MTQQGVRWTAEQVLALAPDAASRKAGSKLGAAGPWSGTGTSDEGTLWGLCKGSGSKPYQTVVDVADASGPAYKCSCPSRKFPCKHALGLLLLWSGDDGAVPRGQAPEWAEQWTAGRRQRAAEQRTPGAAGAPAAADPEAARRRAERRAERISAGATELEQRLADLLRGGLAAAEQAGYGLWEETAARMVDAQAPGLAARVRELGGRSRRPDRAGRCGCWRSARCFTSSTRAGCTATGCRRAWRPRSVPGSGCPPRRTARRCATAGWSSPSTTRRTRA
ncbi:hypothetical protein GCM10020295_31410 [Streptomyces cinereospinus]